MRIAKVQGFSGDFQGFEGQRGAFAVDNGMSSPLRFAGVTGAVYLWRG
jgi:hypothetical protein